MEQRIFDGAHLRAELHGAGRKGLFVSFDHWRGASRAGFVPMAPVQTALDMGYANLVIATAADDWFLNADLAATLQAVAAVAQDYPVVRAIGFSMGGYGALLFSRALNLRSATLFAPQAAIRPGQIPQETRWPGTATSAMVADALRLYLRPGLRGTVLMDPFAHPAERAQARAVQALAPGLALVALPFSGHPPTAVLMRGQAYPQLLAAAVAGKATPALIRSLQRRHRWSCETYLRRLDAALQQRDCLPLSRTGT
ncbi:MAG: alpha/beta hydrolase [Rhodobacteraceae bacterium]|nr:alpha/beta hydrolase [Paracoccaceae bacterium]